MGEITLLLQQWNGGDPAAVEPLFQLVLPQLRQIAGALFRGERFSSVLQPTSLINELYLKLVRQKRLCFEDRKHFFSLAARLMRRVLVDYARADSREKRDVALRVPLHDELPWVNAVSVDVMDLDSALEEMEALDPRKCRLVELRYFLGFSAEETAEMLGISKATVDRDLKFARGWLYDRLHFREP